MIQIVEVNDPLWSSIVERANDYDFYHTQSYHLLEQGNEPVLFVVNLDQGFIALPLIIRQIDGTPFFDCTSAYGYCGPITNFDINQLDSSNLEVFNFELLKFFKEKGIISAFSRLHPLLANHSILGGIGEIVPLNLTVAIDLRQNLEDQRKQFRKSNKSELNQLRRKGFHVREAESEEEIDKFIQIYYETMDRVKASNMYYFDHKYFYEFLNNPCFKSRLLLAVYEDEIAAGAIFTLSDKIMQYHLAGTESKFIRDTPMKLIIDEARLLGSKLTMKYLHLGGGVGGSDTDTLFKFKSGFSNLHFQYRIWKLVIDEDVYSNLVKRNGLIPGQQRDYFPLYRMPNN